MASYTITTSQNIDELSGKGTGGDTYNINGGYLTVDQDSRYGLNNTTSTPMGAITLSATLGGTIEFKGDKVRLIPYNTGTGNVPAYNTTISQGSASGKMIGVYSALNVAPTAPGAAMPASGFIKIKQWNSVAFAAGALTGIGASATGVDVAGWLEIAGIDGVTATCVRLGTFKVTGDWYLLPNTDGTRATTYQIPSNGAVVYLPGVYVETGAGTGVYEFYPCMGSQTATSANIATDAVRGKVCWISTAGLLRFGHDGTNSTGGYCPPAGLKVRIPNVFFMTCAGGAPTVNNLPNATLGTRYDFTTTGGAVLQIDKASMNWSLGVTAQMAQSYSVSLTNSGFLGALVFSEVASAMTISNCGVGHEAAVAFVSLTLSLCFAGGTISDCVFSKASLATTNVLSLTDMTGFTFTNVTARTLITRAAASMYVATLTRVSNSTFSGTVMGGAGHSLVTCTTITYTNSVYYDNVNTTTGTANPCFAWTVATLCSGIKMDGLTFGSLVMNQPYSGLLSIAAAGCSNIKLRNIGSAATPLSMGGAYASDVSYSQSTTTVTVTKTAHGLKANDLINVVSIETLSGTTTLARSSTTATLRTVASAPTADTFTITVTTGTATGTLCYFPCVVNNLVTITAGAAASNVSVQRCYTFATRSDLISGDNSNKGVYVDNCSGTDWAIYVTSPLNFLTRGVVAAPAYTAQTACYGTHWVDSFPTGTPANLTTQSWTRSTTIATLTSNAHGLKVGDLILVTVSSSETAIPLGVKTLTQSVVTTGSNTENKFTFTCLNAGSASGTLSYIPLNGRFALLMNEPTADTTAQYTAEVGTPKFTSAGSIYMPAVNDQALWTTPDYVLGHVNFPIALPVMGGGTLANHDVTYSLDRNDGNGYGSFKNLAYPRTGGGGSGSSTTVTMTSTTGVAAGDYVFGTGIAPNAKVVTVDSGTNVTVNIANTGAVSGTLTFMQLPSEADLNPALGFKMKIRIKTTTTNTAAITSLAIYTQSTAASRQNQYPLDLVSTTINVRDENNQPIPSAKVWVGKTSDNSTLVSGTTDASGVLTGSVSYTADIPVTIRARKASAGAVKFQPLQTVGTILSSGLTSTVVLARDLTADG